MSGPTRTNTGSLYSLSRSSVLLESDRDLILDAIAEIVQLRARQEDHLALIAKMSKESVSPEDAMELNRQIAVLISEVGTLRSVISNCSGSCPDELLLMEVICGDETKGSTGDTA